MIPLGNPRVIRRKRTIKTERGKEIRGK